MNIRERKRGEMNQEIIKELEQEQLKQEELYKETAVRIPAQEKRCRIPGTYRGAGAVCPACIPL